MYFLLVYSSFLFECYAREQYPWSGSDEIDEDVDLLLKQGLKIGYLPKTSINGGEFIRQPILMARV